MEVHKSLVRGIPKIRPILSAIGTAAYGLSKFLVPLLENVAIGPYTIKNSFSFNQEVLQQDSSLVMGSLDVDALFTSIPLDETIKICVEQLFKDKSIVSNLDKKEFHCLLNLACKNALFIFDGVYYNQIDGVAMGSPLGPQLANAFMNYYEQIWLDECPIDIKPRFYKRYVDDIFILCKSKEQLEKFQNYLNSKHPHITFTSEIEEEGKLPFLDMLINRNDGVIKTSVYRKPTFTGVYTHFHSFLPSMYKLGLLSTILFRYFSVCSSYWLFHLEVLEFKKIFLRNGYPPKFIERCIYKFLDKIFRKKVIYQTVPKREFLITLPYLGPLSEKTLRGFRNIFKNTIKMGKINVVFRTKRRISHLLRFKDTVPSFLESHIIYHFKCPSCNAGYVGETRAHFKTRSCQHLRISPWTNKPVKGGVPTSISAHMDKNNCHCRLNNFSILGREVDYNLRLMKESLFIKLHNYSLNVQQTSTELHLF